MLVQQSVQTVELTQGPVTTKHVIVSTSIILQNMYVKICSECTDCGDNTVSRDKTQCYSECIHHWKQEHW